MNLFTGDRGLLSYFDKKELEQNLNERKISITQKVSNLENKNLLLSDNLNFDYIDTLIRDKLKYGNTQFQQDTTLAVCNTLPSSSTI